MTELKAKIRKPIGCEAGDHNFIVSNWIVKSDRQRAVSYICQRCLMPIDGREALQVVMDGIHAKTEP